MSHIGRAVPLLMGSWLILAAYLKLASAGDFVATLASLGLRFPRTAAGSAIGIEFGVGAVETIQPTSMLALLLVTAAFVSFAAAGFQAMRRDLAVRCTCFGALGRAQTLGRLQILQAPPAIALALFANARGVGTGAWSALSICGVLATCAAFLTLGPSISTIRAARVQRASLETVAPDFGGVSLRQLRDVRVRR